MKTNMLKITPISQDNAKLEDFELFWSIYPRKVAKLEAKRAWEQTKKIRPPIEELLGAVRRLCTGCENLQFCPHASTWLRRGQWLDE